MRCDGQRPTCNQCIRSNIVDCEYTDEGPTVSQLLEQKIAYLEARIRELEGDSGSITLHDPHAPGPSSSSQPRVTRGPATIGGPQPSIPRNQRIMQAFMSYACDFGFFLHMPRFIDKLSASIPPTNESPLPAALVHSVFLIGLTFSSDATLKQEEPRVLARVQQALSSELDPSSTLYMLQAEVLLTYYLLHTNRRAAAGYHSAAAVSIAVGCKLHKIRSSEWFVPGASFSNASVPEVQLFPPMDDIEEGERIRAFWTVFTLDRCLTVVFRTPSLLARPGTAAARVDAPWPLEMSGYEQHLLMPQGSTSARTVEHFVNGLSTELPNQSMLALRAKAAIVFERSAYIADNWNPNDPRFQAEFLAADARIEQVRSVLPDLHSVDLNSDVTASNRTQYVRDLLMIHTLCHAATLQLHTRFGPSWDVDRSKAIQAAVSSASILNGIDINHWVYVDPIIGMLWHLVGETLVNALAGLRRNVTYAMSPSVAVSPQEIMISTSITTILTAMNTLKRHCPLIGEETDKLQTLMGQNLGGVPT